MSKLYLITYNSDPLFDKNIFHNYISNLYSKGYISDWWHYTDLVYIVASNLDVNSLYNYLIYPKILKKYLLVIEINLNNAQGWLPKDAWAWLQKYK